MRSGRRVEAGASRPAASWEERARPWTGTGAAGGGAGRPAASRSSASATRSGSGPVRPPAPQLKAAVRVARRDLGCLSDLLGGHAPEPVLGNEAQGRLLQSPPHLELVARACPQPVAHWVGHWRRRRHAEYLPRLQSRKHSLRVKHVGVWMPAACAGATTATGMRCGWGAWKGPELGQHEAQAAQSGADDQQQRPGVDGVAELLGEGLRARFRRGGLAISCGSAGRVIATSPGRLWLLRRRVLRHGDQRVDVDGQGRPRAPDAPLRRWLAAAGRGRRGGTGRACRGRRAWARDRRGSARIVGLRRREVGVAKRHVEPREMSVT